MKISLIVTMNIFNDITVHAASFELESQIYFLDDFRQKRPLWYNDNDEAKKKEKTNCNYYSPFPLTLHSGQNKDNIFC